MTHRGISVVRAWKDILEILVKALFVNQILVKIVVHVMSIKAGLEMIINPGAAGAGDLRGLQAVTKT